MALLNVPFEIVEKIATWIRNDGDLVNFSTVTGVDTVFLPFKIERYKNMSFRERDARLFHYLREDFPLDHSEVVALTKAGARIRMDEDDGIFVVKAENLYADDGFHCFGHVESVRDLIIRHNIDVNGKSPETEGLTLLQHAVQYHKKDQRDLLPLIKYLSSQMTVDAIETADEDGQTALHFAAQKNHLDVVTYLTSVMTRSGIDKTDDVGHTALNYAIDAIDSSVVPADISVIQHLMSVMSSDAIKTKDFFGCTVLHYAVSYEASVVKHLTAGMTQSGIDAQDDRGETALHHAVRLGNFAVLKHLVSVMSQSGIEVTNEQGHTALHQATLLGSQNYTNYWIKLLQKYECCRAQSDDEIHALMRKRAKFAQYLIKYMGSEAINAKDTNGRTALMLADPSERECAVMLAS